MGEQIGCGEKGKRRNLQNSQVSGLDLYDNVCVITEKRSTERNTCFKKKKERKTKKERNSLGL